MDGIKIALTLICALLFVTTLVMAIKVEHRVRKQQQKQGLLDSVRHIYPATKAKNYIKDKIRKENPG